jgi:hypothetical protein
MTGPGAGGHQTTEAGSLQPARCRGSASLGTLLPLALLGLKAASACALAELLGFESRAGVSARLERPLNQLCQQRKLLLLKVQQLCPLRLPQVVQLLVQQHDFQLGLQVDFVVVFGV